MVSLVTNQQSLITQRCLSNANNSISTALERMSTGFKLNHAKDDAAGLYVATSLNTQMRGLTQANNNTQLGINLLNIADGSLNQMSNLLLRMRDLALQASNEVYDSNSLSSLDNEAQSLTNELYRVKNTTTFNGLNIFGEVESHTPQAFSLRGGGG